MAAITIRQLDPMVKQRLRERAAANGRSMEAEARALLELSLSDSQTRRDEPSAYDVFHSFVEGMGGLTDAEVDSINAARPSPTLVSEPRDPFAVRPGA